MSVRIVLHQPHNSFTNLDVVEGTAVLSLVSQETIAAITVKLEGESRTRLAGVVVPPGRPGRQGAYDGFQKDQTQLEVHKLLYKVATVFPTPDIQQTSSRMQYTLPPGQHEYPFRFKIPFNNDCYNNNSLLSNLSSMRMDMAQGANAHVKKTLPPSLSGLPGEAEIQYYIKATVQRPAFYKENFRAHSKFLFCPIEPPRPPPNKRESYGRRSHRFAPTTGILRKAGLFGRPSEPQTDPGLNPPSVVIDGRLPDPAILTCNDTIPLRILVTKENDSPATIFLQTLHIELIGYTGLRAHELRRTEVTSWVIMSSSNMRLPLINAIGNEADSQALEIDSELWSNRPLPSTVAPSFDTCNMSRSYALDIKVGLSWGSGKIINPELTVQPIRMPVQVYSGIAPPQALLAAMADRPPPRPPRQQTVPPLPPHPPLGPNGVAQGSSRPPQPPSDHIEPSPSDIPDEAPPSYEDAMADDLGPIDGPRRDYHQQTTQAPAYGDEKASNDERLFPGSGR